MSASLAIRLIVTTSMFSLLAAAATNSIEKGFKVSPSQIALQWGAFKPFLASQNGNFALGFDDVGANNYILALMYTIGMSSDALSNHSEVPVSMAMVWSANPKSASADDGVLAINEQGNMVLTESSNGSIVWATDTVDAGPITLILADSGNLMLLNSSTSNTNATHAFVLWQSFEHPTDTLLQGQNFTASMRLTSALSAPSDVPASVFLKMEADGMALYANLSQGSSQLMYWKLDADQETATIDSANASLYARIEKMGFLGIFVNESERVSYETFLTYNSSEIAYRRLKLDSDGNLRVYYWANTSWRVDYEAINEPCGLPSACGPYGVCKLNGECICPTNDSIVSSGVIAEKDQNVSFVRMNDSDATQGCILSTATSIANYSDVCDSERPGNSFFVQLVGVDSLFHQYAKANTGASSNASSVEECEAQCRPDCGCMAFFYRVGVANKCFLARNLAEQSMFQTGNSNDLAFIRPSDATATAMEPGKAPLQQAEPAQRRKRKSVVAFVIIPAAIVLLAAAVLIIATSYRYSKRRRAGRVDADRLEQRAFLSEMPGLPVFLPYKEVESCTAYFRRHSSAGALGSWYEGVLPNGTPVAITKIKLVDADQRHLHNVKLTLASVGRLTHTNLAKLCCYSIEGTTLALGYELPPDGWLKLAELSWQQRVQLAMGVAGALAALHEGARMFHGLLSLEAVFVSGGCDARLGGVGVAELVAAGLADAPYLAEPPERAAAEDVLQYGVVLTELLTGQQISGQVGSWRLRWQDAIRRGSPGELFDRAIVGQAERSRDKLPLRLATSAGLCLHPSPLQRPPISTVLHILDGSIANLPVV